MGYRAQVHLDLRPEMMECTGTFIHCLFLKQPIPSVVSFFIEKENDMHEMADDE